MNKQDLINYLLETPENTNISVFSSLLDKLLEDSEPSKPEVGSLTIENQSGCEVTVYGMVDPNTFKGISIDIPDGETATCYRLLGTGAFSIHGEDGEELTFYQKKNGDWEQVNLSISYLDDGERFYCSRNTGAYSGGFFAAYEQSMVSGVPK